jgi:hypothetical protein
MQDAAFYGYIRDFSQDKISEKLSAEEIRAGR